MTWAAIGAAAISAGVGMYQSHQAKKKSGAQKTAEQLQLDALKQMFPFGQRNLQAGEDANNRAMKFFSGVARDPRASMAPELNARAASDRATMSAIGGMAPRGGASADVLSRLPWMRAGQTTNMLFNARNNAYNQIATLGASRTAAGLSALSGGMGGGMSLLNYNLNRNQQGFDQGAQSGYGTYQLAKGIIDAWGKRSNGGQSTDWTNGANAGSQAGGVAQGIINGWG